MAHDSPDPAREALAGYRHEHYVKRTIDGRPPLYKCLGCGQPAEDWAYSSSPDDSADPQSPNGPFAPGQPDRLRHLCKYCHCARDAFVKARLKEAERYQESDPDFVAWRRSDVILVDAPEGLVRLLRDEGWLA